MFAELMKQIELYPVYRDGKPRGLFVTVSDNFYKRCRKEKAESQPFLDISEENILGVPFKIKPEQTEDFILTMCKNRKSENDYTWTD